MLVICFHPGHVESTEMYIERWGTPCMSWTAAVWAASCVDSRKTAWLMWQCDNQNLKLCRRCNNMSRINLSGYIGNVTIFSWMFTIACCLVVGLGLGLGLGLDLVSGWLVVMHTYLCYFSCNCHIADDWSRSVWVAFFSFIHCKQRTRSTQKPKTNFNNKNNQ